MLWFILYILLLVIDLTLVISLWLLTVARLLACVFYLFFFFSYVSVTCDINCRHQFWWTSAILATCFTRINGGVWVVSVGSGSCEALRDRGPTFWSGSASLGNQDRRAPATDIQWLLPLLFFVVPAVLRHRCCSLSSFLLSAICRPTHHLVSYAVRQLIRRSSLRPSVVLSRHNHLVAACHWGFVLPQATATLTRISWSCPRHCEDVIGHSSILWVCSYLSCSSYWPISTIRRACLHHFWFG